MIRSRRCCVNCGTPLSDKQTKYCCTACQKEFTSNGYRKKPSSKPAGNSIDAYIAEIKDGPYISYGEWMAKKIQKK